MGTIKQQKKLRGDDISEAQKASMASFDDERARQEEIKHLQAKKQEQAINDEVRKLRMDKGKATEMKHQASLKVQMEQLNKMGATDQAQKLRDRLDPGKDELGRERKWRPPAPDVG